MKKIWIFLAMVMVVSALLKTRDWVSPLCTVLYKDAGYSAEYVRADGSICGSYEHDEQGGKYGSYIVNNQVDRHVRYTNDQYIVKKRVEKFCRPGDSFNSNVW